MANEERQLQEIVDTTTNLDSFDSTLWTPRNYLEEFYKYPHIAFDEREAVRHQVEFARTLQGAPVVLEFGSGPTAHRAIAIAPYVSEIHIAEFLPDNINELSNWVLNKESQHNWDHYVAYILELEGSAPTEVNIELRKEETRSKIKAFFQADAGNSYPLGEKYHGYYSHVYSGFCADSATGKKDVWETYMRNIVSLVAPGGTFWTGALRKTKSYKTGPHYFPSANIDESDLQRVLGLDFLVESITIDVKAIPEMKEHGFEGILLAHAQKANEIK